MKTEYGSTDAAASSCVLLYDFFGNSYAGEPTVNLFIQPIGATIFSGVYASSVDDCGAAGTIVYLNGDQAVNFPPGPALVTGYLDFTQTGGGGTAPVDGYYILNISGNKNYTICGASSVVNSNGLFTGLYDGFAITPQESGRAFFKLDYSDNLNGQGNFFSNATGNYRPTDSIYKYNFTGSQKETASITNKHGFQVKINKGDTYTASAEVFVSSNHPRTGVLPVISLTPTSTGSYAILTGSYNFDQKGTWQKVSEKIFLPATTSNTTANATYYEVSVKQKTAAHPYYGSGSAQGFVIGNTEGRVLNLYRGTTYVFVQSNSSNVNDEFYISTTAAAGGGSNAYANGFSYYGNEGFDGYAVFSIPSNAPSILFYNSQKANSSYVGGKINVLGSFTVGNVGNAGNAGSGGSGGSSGSSGFSGSTATSDSYQICFDPTRNEFQTLPLNGGYILYKNMQVEKNKPMFKGVIHSTKFTPTSRSAYSSLVDLTGGDNNSNLVNAMFDSNSNLLFGNRINLQDGGLVDINLKYNKSKLFSIGDNATQTYDFWFTQSRASYQRAFLFARSNAIVGDYFLENQGYPQLIYIQDKRVYFSFTSSGNEILSGYSEQLIELNILYNVTVCINTYLGDGSKIDIYVNGVKATVTIISISEPPSNFSFNNVASSTGNIGLSGNIGFQGSNNNFYCVSAYDSNGESRASSAISASSDPLKKSIRLSWNIVSSATGYYLYRSSSPVFSSSSLLADINNKNILNYTDENFQLRPGFPKAAAKYTYNYNKNINFLVDSSSARACFGNYPLSSFTLNHFEGYIYRLAIYKIKLTEQQVNRNYNSFLYKYISQDPNIIGSYAKQRSVIFKRVKE